MKKTIKKALCILSATLCVMGSAITASADTVTFNVTPPGDPYSYSVRKADTEQNAYFTGTYFSNSRTLYCYSQQLNDGTVTSSTASLNSGNRSAVKAYNSWAAPYLYYQMFSWANGSINVQGRFTP